MSVDSEYGLVNVGDFLHYEHIVNLPAQLSPGCVLCMQGRMLVVSLTLKCGQNCFYCPIPDTMHNKDFVCLNDQVLQKASDLGALRDCVERTGARGCGITGGDPLSVVPRALQYIAFLKSEFGSDFYVHMYTWGGLATRKVLQRLERAGLDELRFHLWPDDDFERILPALSTRMTIGIEIPADPKRMNEMKQIVQFARRHRGIHFINLNQMEYHPQSAWRIRERGFDIPPGRSGVVPKSMSAAKRIMKFAGDDVAVHFCPTKAKRQYQIVNRLRSEAFNTLKPYEKVSHQGLIVKGVVRYRSDHDALAPPKRWEGNMEIDHERHNITCSLDILQQVAEWCAGQPWVVYCKPDAQRTVLKEFRYRR